MPTGPPGAARPATATPPPPSPPTEFSEDKNIRWKTPIPGLGSGSPIVWENKIFLQTAIAGDAGPKGPHKFVVLCIDRETGKTLWQQVATEATPHEGTHPDGNFAPFSPVTNGKQLVALFGSRGLYCYDLDGKLLWQKDLGRMQIKRAFGEGASPALHNNTLIINWDHEGEDFIAAFDVESGKELWRQKRDEMTSWSTPLIVEHNGKPQAIVPATGKIRSYDLADGKILWEVGGLTPNVIPCPVSADGIVYLMSGFRGNALLAVRLGATGDLSKSDAVLWRHDKNTPYVPSPLLYNGRLYFFGGNRATLSCLDAKTGNAHYSAQSVDAMRGVYASPVAADGRVYLVDREGTVVVIKDADKFEVLATNKLNDRFDASPALAGNTLILRGQKNLYCIGE